MVETDVGDNGEYGTDDVRAVKSTAKAYFDYSNIHLLLLKVFKGQSCDQFEEGGGQSLEYRAIFFNKADNAFLGNHLPVDANPFAEVYEMWTRIEPYLVSRGLQNGCQRMAGTSFSVGATYMDGTIVPVRMVKVIIQKVSIA